MTCHLATVLAEAAARNREALGERCRTYSFRIELADGTQIEERAPGMSVIAAHHPGAAVVVNLALRPDGNFF